MQGGAKYWALFMDDNSGFLISRFLNQLKDQHGIEIKIIRCDNAGENKKMDDACIEQRMGIKFEYTAFGTLNRMEG